MNVVERTEEDLRVVLAERTQRPGVDDVSERLIASFTHAGATPARRRRPDTAVQSGRDQSVSSYRASNHVSGPHRRTLAAVCTAVAAVLIVILGAVALTDRTHRPAEPTTAWNSQPPGYPTEWLYGPSSLPGFTLTSAVLTPSEQGYEFFQGNTYTAPPALGLQLDVFVPAPAVLTAIGKLAAVRVGAMAGRYGTIPGAGQGVESAISGPSTGKYKQIPALQSSILLWPLDATRWAMVTASVNGGKQLLPESDLIARSASLTPAVDDHAALVKVGYVPAGLHFAAAGIGEPTQYVADEAGHPIDNEQDGLDGMSGTNDRDLVFTTGPTPSLFAAYSPVLAIDAASNPSTALVTAKPANLPNSNMITGPWKKTTIQGHLAWIAPHDILIQWGDIQIGVSSTHNLDPTSPLLDQQQLLKVANSLTVPDDVSFGHGYPLLTSVPAGALP